MVSSTTANNIGTQSWTNTHTSSPSRPHLVFLNIIFTFHEHGTAAPAISLKVHSCLRCDFEDWLFFTCKWDKMNVNDSLFLTFNAMWLACSSSLQMTHPFINPFSYHLYGSTWIAKCIKSPLSLTLLLRPDASLAHFGTAAIKRWQETWMVLQFTKARMSVCWQRHYSVGWSIVFVSCSFVCLFFNLKCVNVSTPQCLITVRDVWNLSGFMTA